MAFNELGAEVDIGVQVAEFFTEEGQLLHGEDDAAFNDGAVDLVKGDEFAHVHEAVFVSYEVIEVGWAEFEGRRLAIADGFGEFANARSQFEDGVGVAVVDVEVTLYILSEFINFTVLSVASVGSPSEN